MSKREDQKMAKLIKKTAGKVSPKKTDRSGQYDDTLRKKPADMDDDTKRFFDDMKRREF